MRLLFCASGRFPNDQRWECDMGLHIEIRSFDLLQNIFSGLHPHIVDVDVHDREHSWESHLKRAPQGAHKKRGKPFASISFENTFMLFLLPIFTYSYLFRLRCKLLSQYIPQGTCNTYRRVSTTDDTYHQRQCEVTDAGHAPDVQRTYHYQSGQGCE